MKRSSNFWGFLRFCWKQSLSHIREEWIIIVCVGLSISMLAGLAYFSQAIQKYQFKNEFTTIADFEISHLQSYGEGHSAIPRLNFSANFESHRDLIPQRLENSGLDLEGYCQYGILSIEEGFWAFNNWENVNSINYASELTYKQAMNATQVEFVASDDHFYTSSRFTQFFHIIAGTYPTQTNEILVDYSFARRMNLTIGLFTNLTVLLGSILDVYPLITLLEPFQLENITIVGIYLPIQNEYIIDTEQFLYSYNYTDYVDERPLPDKFQFLDEPALFTYYNFSGIDGLHPMQRLYQSINNTSNFQAYLRSAYTRSGYLVFYARNHIDYANLRTYRTSIASQSNNLSFYLPLDVNYRNILTLQLIELYNSNLQARLFIQILNIPLIILSIFIGQNLFSVNYSKKLKKLQVLHAKGFTIGQLKSQFLLEKGLFGIIASIIGLILGLGTFFIYRIWLIPALLPSYQANISLLPIVTNRVILSCCFIGVFIGLLVAIPGLKEIKRIRFEDEAAHTTQRASKSKHLLGSESNEFPQLFEESEKKPISLISIFIMMILGTIPLLGLLLLIIGSKWAISDILIDIYSFIHENLLTLVLFSFIAFVLLIIVIIRVCIEKYPKVYNKISSLFLSLVLGPYHQFAAGELHRQRNWIKILTYMAIFIGLLLNTNILLNSQYRFEQVNKNILIGGDFKINIPSTNKFQNVSQFDNLEQKIEDYESIETITTCYIDSDATFENKRGNQTFELIGNIYSIDIMKYIDIIQAGQKIPYYPDFYTDITALSEKLSTPGVFVSQRVISHIGFEVGDILVFDHQYYDSNSSSEKIMPLTLKILGAIDIAPGLFDTVSITDYCFLIDSHVLSNNSSLLHGTSFIQLGSLKNTPFNDQSGLHEQLTVIFESLYNDPQIQFYNPLWNDVTNVQLSIQFGTSGFFGVLYYNFILFGFLLAIELGLMGFLIYEDNKQLYRTLHNRGISYFRIIGIFIINFTIIMILALLLGMIIGGVYSILLKEGIQRVSLTSMDLNLPWNSYIPLFFDYTHFFSIVGIFFGCALLLFGTSFIISQTFNKKRDMQLT